MIRAVFFDMDGTLLPMDQQCFVEGYTKLLCAYVAPIGIEPRMMVKALWDGVAAMQNNDGSITNGEAFWQSFEKTTGISRSVIEPACDEFYGSKFNDACVFTQPNSMAAEAVRTAGENGRTVVLATNPLFPYQAQLTRLSWTGIDPSSFALISHYGTDRFSKPASGYYLDLCKKLQLKPEEVLMVGNDEWEDMYGASAAGLHGFLLTDCLIPAKHSYHWDGPRGSFPELIEYLRNLV